MDEMRASMEKVVPISTELLELHVHQNPLEEIETQGDMKSGVEFEVVNEDDKVFEVDVTVVFGFENTGPFDLKARLRTTYRKKEKFEAAALLAKAPLILYPSLAETSFLISVLTRSMDMMPLIVGPYDLLDMSEEDE